MKKFSTNLKYITFSFALILAIFSFTHSVSADTYYNACDGASNTDYMTSVVNVSNAGPFSSDQPVSVSATIQILDFCDTYTAQSVNSAEIRNEFTPTSNYVFGSGTSLISNQIVPAVSGPYPIVPINYNFTTIPVVGTHYLHLSLKTVRSPIHCSPQVAICPEITTVFNNYLGYQILATATPPVVSPTPSVFVEVTDTVTPTAWTAPILDLAATNKKVNVQWTPNFDTDICKCSYRDKTNNQTSSDPYCGISVGLKKGITHTSSNSYSVPKSTIFDVACTDYVAPPVATPVNGVCDNTTRNSCSAGTPNDAAISDTSSTFNWQCDGSNGGTNAACQKSAYGKVWINNSLFEWNENTVYNSSQQNVGYDSTYGGKEGSSGTCGAALNGQTLYRPYCSGTSQYYSTYEAWLAAPENESGTEEEYWTAMALLDGPYSCEWYKATCNGSTYIQAPDHGACSKVWCGDGSSASDAITATQAYKFSPGICPQGWYCINNTN